MSRPFTFVPPPGAMAGQLRTARGDFAVIDAPAATGTKRLSAALRRPGAPGTPPAPRTSGQRPEPRGTVLLLPGYTGSKEDFIALHEPLAAAGYRSIAVDGRGQYETPGPADDEGPYAQDELAQDVLAQAAAVPGPVHLVGHSFGGVIARAAVLRDPRPFRSLTLIACGPAEISLPQQHRVKQLRDLLALRTMAEAWDIIQRLESPEETATGTPTDTAADDSAEARLWLQRRWLGTQPAQLLAAGRQLCTEPDRTDQLAAVRLPKHVLSGELDDTWPVSDLGTMARRLGAHRTVIQGAEHSPAVDRPGQTAAALTAFWDDCDT